MVAMSYLLTRVKQDGTMFQTEDLMFNKIPDKVNITQSMYITTICTLIFMKNQEKLEELKVHHQINS